MRAVQKTSGATLSIDTMRRVHRSNLRLVLIIASVWVVIDQITKIWAVRALTGRDPIPVVGEILQFRLVYNPGAAFSLGTGSTWVFTILASVVVTVLLWNSRKIAHRGWAVALALLIGGAAGNLIDRLAREPGFGRGHVVDFFALPNFPVFNVADIGISCAAAFIALLALRGESIDGSDDAPSNVVEPQHE